MISTNRNLIAITISLALGVAGCSQRTSPPVGESPPRPPEAETVTPPPARATRKPPASAPSSPLRPTRAARTAPPASEPASTPPPARGNPDDNDQPSPAEESVAESNTPRYIKVLELESLAAEPVLSVALDPPVRIALETRNIKRFAITRIGLPLDRPGKSIALKIDGQVFEWQGKHITVVFEHSPNGGWQVIDRVAIEP